MKNKENKEPEILSCGGTCASLPNDLYFQSVSCGIDKIDIEVNEKFTLEERLVLQRFFKKVWINPLFKEADKRIFVYFITTNINGFREHPSGFCFHDGNDHSWICEKYSKNYSEKNSGTITARDYHIKYKKGVKDMDNNRTKLVGLDTEEKNLEN
jgi:hypothetical protein